MKILYFGTVCDPEHYNEIMKNCRFKPSVAPLVFESALLEGLKKNGADVSVHSYPMIPNFPNSGLLYFGGKAEKLPSGYQCRWLKTFNLPFLKQLTRQWDGRRILRRWAKENRNEGVILTYSIPPFLIKDIIKYSKKYSLKVVPVITDLLRDMYIDENNSGALKKLKELYLNSALKLQGECSGYVYLAEAMKAVVAPEKPFIVMEGIVSEKASDSPRPKKSEPRSIMYAGMLHKKYGILNLLDAFESLEKTETELWLFGEGSATEEIKERAAENRRIKYFGSVSHEKILEYEKEATLLVNPRDPKEEFTKYSFPSKTTEYMLSGTPLLTTELEGIPKEYFDYAFTAENNSVESLKNEIEKALDFSDKELYEIGKRARKFLIKNKNAEKQAKRILCFIESLN